MDLFIKYSDDFRRLVNAVYETYIGYPPEESRKDISRVIYEADTLARLYPYSFNIEKEDVEQELRLMWLRFYKSYYKNEVHITLRQYLIRRSAWGLRDWLTSQKHTSRGTYLGFFKEERPKISLNLEFLLNGESWLPLTCLSAHQRYLIYLKFVEDKDILGIANHLQKDRHVISRQFKETINSIRRVANEERNTG